MSSTGTDNNHLLKTTLAWMWSSAWPLSLLLFLAAAVGLQAARPRGDDASSLLRKADGAEQRVAYVGTKVVRQSPGQGGAPTENEVKVWHDPPDKTRLEVLPPASIAGLITIEAGDKRFHYHPWNSRWVSFPRPYKPSRPPLEMLLRNYTVRDAGNETIAGRNARILQIRSRHPGNAQKNIWVDRRTGVVLKTELLDETGRCVSWWQFREIDFPSTVPAGLFSIPADTTPPTEGARPRPPVPQKIEKPGFTVLEPRSLPTGYAEVRRSAYRMHGAESVVIRYTDGLNVILFVQQRFDPRSREGAPPGRPERRKPEGPGPEDRGPGPRYRRGPPMDVEGDVAAHVNWRLGELRLTLIGGVDRPSLERMAASVSAPSAAGSEPPGRRPLMKSAKTNN